MLKNDFKCLTLDYTTMTRPSDPTDFQNPYFAETHALSGPGAFFGAMKDVAEGALGENVDIRGAAMRGVGVHAARLKGLDVDGGEMADEGALGRHGKEQNRS